MIKPMWDSKAVEAYETGQGVELVNDPHPHYEPVQKPKQMTGKQPPAPWNTTSPQRTWVGLMHGVRVDGDTVVISVKGGNDAARELCGALIEEMNK